MTAGTRKAVAEVRDLVTRFGDHVVHDRVTLAVNRGEILAIVGESGTGKSLLLRHMITLGRPDAGEVTLLGMAVAALDAPELLRLRRRIGVLFQGGALFSDLSVLENVMVPLREHTRISEGLMRELAAVKIRMSGLGTHAGDLFPAQLSGGMRKRAALARAIALDPELLFLDEPGSGLDPVGAGALDALVLQLRKSLGLTVVMITHDMESLWRVADRVILLGESRIIGEGTMEELYQSDDPRVRRFFRGPRAAPGGRAA